MAFDAVAQLEALWEAPIGLALFDLELRYLRVNGALAAINGVPAAAHVGRTVLEVLPDQNPAVVDQLRQVRDTGVALDVEVAGRTPRAPELLQHWRVSYFPIRDGGAVTAVGASVVEITDQRRAERAAQAERDFVAAVLDTTANLILVLDREGAIVRFNRACERVTGYAAAEVLGRRVFEVFIAPEELGEVRETFQRLRRGDFPNTHRNCWRLKDGSRRLFEWANTCIADERGAVEFVIATGTDLTDRLRAEDGLRGAEQRLRAVIQELPSGLIVADLETRDLQWNEEALAIHGYTREGSVHQFLESLIADHDLRTLDRRPIPVDDWPLPRLLAGQSFRDYEVLVRNVRLGWERVFSYSGVIVQGATEGARLGLLAIQDVTQRRRAEEALRRSEEQARAQAAQLETILDSIGDGVVVYDSTGRTLRSTPAADALLGVPVRDRAAPLAERLMQQYAFFTEDGRALALEEVPVVRAALRAEAVPPLVLRVRNVQGERWLRMRATPLSVDGRHRGAVLSLTDVTDRKRAEGELQALNERLREADRRKDEFLGMLSHELRNPLAPIRNALYILERAEADAPPARRARAIITRQVGHMTRIVDDLLDVTRIARGKIELRRRALDLAALARRTADDHRPVMQDRGLALQVALPPGPVTVIGDETRLAQVLGNLLHNAAKFTPPGGTIALEVGEEDGRAVVRLRDTGVGMDQETLRTVFEPFVQAKQTLARSEGGLGLGLALVQGLVKLHGGDVAAHSAGRGHGTEMVIRVPLQPRAELRDALPGPPGEPPPRRRILVVDDNHDAAETLADLLALGGHEVSVAHDGPSAVASALSTRPDVVLCDIGLPGMDGYEVARTLRARGVDGVRLVAVSGYAQPEDVARATEAGFDAHVAKPPDPERLAKLLV